MAGLFDTSNDTLSQIMAQRQRANQALGSPYGRYSGIMQSAGGMVDTMMDAAAGGGAGASDPAMQKQKELKQIAQVIAQQMGGKTNTPDYFKALAVAVQDKYPDKAEEALAKAAQMEQQAQQTKLTGLKIEEAEKNLKAGEAPVSTIGKLLKDREKYQEGTFGYQALTNMIEKEYGKKTDKDPSVGAKAELFAQTMFMKPFSELDQKQRETVLKKTEDGASLGDGLTALANAMAAKEISKEAAKNTAKEITPVIMQGKENALNALQGAQDILNSAEGIYAGGYSSAKAAVSKYTPFGSQKKLENTEKFVQKIKTTVVPLLKEFGGNDSNEELRFLESMQGGDITQELETIKETVSSAIEKVKRGIKRTQTSYNNISSGKGGVDVSIKENTPAKQVTLSNGTVVTVRRKD